MPSYSRHRATCRVCHKHRDEVGGLTASGLCWEHALQRQEDNLRDLQTHSGPFFHHWRRQIAASVGGVLLDDSKAEA